MPTLAEKPRPIAKDHNGSETGKPVMKWTADADSAAQQNAENASNGRQHRGFRQKLKEHLAAARAQRAADADLARRSVTEST